MKNYNEKIKFSKKNESSDCCVDINTKLLKRPHKPPNKRIINTKSLIWV